MVRTVRVSDWLRANFVTVALQVMLILACSFPAYSQEKIETPQQTNEKIQRLAALVRTQPSDAAVGAGDLLHIDVFDVPELSRDVRVSDTGDIGFPLVPGKIQVAGLNTFQIESKLEQLLIANGLVSHPQVSVFVKDQTSQPISVVGAVMHPLVYQVMRPTSLLELMAQAGGISDDAGSVVIITRAPRPGMAKLETASETSPPTGQDTITIKLQDLLESGNPVYNIPVYGGDVVSVPRAGIVYVLGAGVAQPGGYVLQSHGEQVTVLKALALAHGLNTFAKADESVILRTNQVTGKKDEIPVRIKAIEKRKTDDVALQSNDILYIPDSTGKKVLAKTGEAAIGIGTATAIYRSY